MRRRRNTTWLVSLAAVVFLIPAAVDAAVDEAPAPQPAPDGETFPWEPADHDVPWARVLGGTLFVVGLVCVGVYVIKKLDGGAFRRGQYLEVLESRAVGRKLELHLVRVAGRVILIASGEHGVAAVAELNEEELPPLEEADERPAADGFQTLLQRFAGGNG
ncbi:MAG: flagellar biosynthetic protein FliO [Candidatus Brocadiia bacterium]